MDGERSSVRKEKNNQAWISGVFLEPFRYSHEVSGECFHMTVVGVKRLNGYTDRIPVMISARYFIFNRDVTGMSAEISGEFRSHNEPMQNRTRLCLYLYAKEIRFCSERGEYIDNNQILLRGTIGKQPVYRLTPGGKEITDLLLAVNRVYGKTDYIPCICWGSTARYASRLRTGTQVRLQGRIQSREYVKVSEEGSIRKLAYEISANTLECL